MAAPKKDRLAGIRFTMIWLATDYTRDPNPETWRDLCRAKATLDALLRCAR